MERFWCLRWLAQNEIKQTDAVLLKDDLLRLLEIPLVIPMTGVRHARGTQLKLELIDWDEVDLAVQARVLEVVTTVVTTAETLAEAVELEEADALSEEEQVAEQVADQGAEQGVDSNSPTSDTAAGDNP
jgi:exoribonuclease-2